MACGHDCRSLETESVAFQGIQFTYCHTCCFSLLKATELERKKKSGKACWHCGKEFDESENEAPFRRRASKRVTPIGAGASGWLGCGVAALALAVRRRLCVSCALCVAACLRPRTGVVVPPFRVRWRRGLVAPWLSSWRRAVAVWCAFCRLGRFRRLV